MILRVITTKDQSLSLEDVLRITGPEAQKQLLKRKQEVIWFISIKHVLAGFQHQR